LRVHSPLKRFKKINLRMKSRL